MNRKPMFVKTKVWEKLPLKKNIEKNCNFEELQLQTEKNEIDGISFSKKHYWFSMQQAKLSSEAVT